MILEMIGHEDRYAVEQLQMALFPAETMDNESVFKPFVREF